MADGEQKLQLKQGLLGSFVPTATAFTGAKWAALAKSKCGIVVA